MAKKVLLKDQDNVEVLPITRGELVLDSSGNQAFHSNNFLATDSRPGLTEINYEEVSESNISNTPNEAVKVIQVKSSSDKVYPVTSADAVLVKDDNKVVTLSDTLDYIKLKLPTYLSSSGGKLTGDLESQNILPAADDTYNLGSAFSTWNTVHATTFKGDVVGNVSGSACGILSENIIKTADELDTAYVLNQLKYNVYQGGSTDTIGLKHGDGVILTACWASTMSAVQLALDDSGYNIAFRYKFGSWYNWKKLAFADGTGATGTWPISITGNATGSDVTSKISINTSTTNSYYPLTFVTSAGKGDKELFIDSSTGTLRESTGIRYNPSTKACCCSGGFYELSDKKLKNFGDGVEVDLDKLSKLSKKYFTWKNDEFKAQQIGVSAQEVQELYPEIVNVIDENGTLSVAYDKLSVVALAAIDKLYEEIKTIQNKNSELEDRINKLENFIMHGN